MDSSRHVFHPDSTTEFHVPVGSHLWRVAHTRGGRPFYLLLPDFIGGERIYWPLLSDPSCKAHIAAIGLPAVADMSVLVEGLSRVVDTLDHQPVRLVGTGFGGRLALHFAAAFPRKVSMVIKVSPGTPPGGKSAGEIAMSDPAVLRDHLTAGRMAQLTGSDQRNLLARAVAGSSSSAEEARVTKALMLCAALDDDTPAIETSVGMHDMSASLPDYPSLVDPAGFASAIHQCVAHDA